MRPQSSIFTITRKQSIASDIGAILIVFIVTIVILAALYTWALSFITAEKTAPIITAECYLSTNGNYVIEVVDISPDAVAVYNNYYILVDNTGRAVPGEQGDVREIYCLDLDFQRLEGSLHSNDQNFNISFIDLDADGRISSHDLFVIRSEENGGVARNGYQLVLKFYVTYEKMLTITLLGQGEWETSLPRTSMTTITHDSINLSLDNEISILDSYRYLANFGFPDNLFGYYSQPFSYTGDSNRTIDITILQDGIPFYNDSEFVEYNASFYVNGNLSANDLSDLREEIIHNLSVRLSDSSTNQTLYHGFVQFEMVALSTSSPSFSPPPPLQFITVVILLSMFSITRRKNYFPPRKHK